MAEIPGAANEAADEFAVNPLGELAVGAASTADAAGGDGGRPRLPAQAVRRTGVLRLHRGGLRSILAALTTEPLVVSSSFVGSAAVDADPTTERGGRRVGAAKRRGALAAAFTAVLLIAVVRPEKLPHRLHGFIAANRSGSVHRGGKSLCGGHRAVASTKPLSHLTTLSRPRHTAGPTI
jgi:hypothetical protein